MAAKVLALANLKGGVCKTTLTVTLADALAREGLSVLVVDMDPQASATRLLFDFDDDPKYVMSDVLEGRVSFMNAITHKTTVEGVHLLGANLDLLVTDHTLSADKFRGIHKLREMMETIKNSYDVIVIDTAPAMGVLNANALVACDAVYVPVESGSKLGLAGTTTMKSFIEGAMLSNPNLKIGGAILTKHDMRKRMCQFSAGAVKQEWPVVLDASLSASTDVHKAQAQGKTILQWDRDHTVSKQIVAMAREIMKQHGIKAKQVETEAENV